jgi:hypothetical protein
MSEPLNISARVLSPTAVAAGPPKVLIAVHGIGDQIGYASVQAVASRIAAYYGIAPAIPLGRFYAPAASADDPIKPAPTLMVSPPDPEELRGIGFAEVYWADIAREVAKGYILEESKRWARTITARLALRAGRQGQRFPARESERLVTVLEEIIEAIFVLERLSFVAEKAGLFKFSLKEVLVSFLGDVQIVADFVAYRQRILAQFDTVMRATAELESEGQRPELYIVAHSEGSVLAFLGLLTALSRPRDAYPWVRSVRGLMTIGSPIESHHLLWPQLWDELRPHPDHRDVAITWWNYFDYGDPIAYSLVETRKWLEASGWHPQLTCNEIAFSRSYLPGKAHVDYWEDDELFGHFLDHVVHPVGVARSGGRSSPKELPNRPFAVAVSYGLPQLLVAAPLFVATYLLYRAIAAALGNHPTAHEIVADVSGIGLLLLGMTAASRLPRLTDKYRWWMLSVCLLVLSMIAYWQLVGEGTRKLLGYAFEHTRLAAVASEFTIGRAHMDRSTSGVLGAAALTVMICGTLASWGPIWGVRLLPVLGVLATTGLIATLLIRSVLGTDANIWPVVLAGGAFFYLWWLTAILFDLVFVWQRYVRHSAALVRIGELVTKGYQQPPTARLATAGEQLSRAVRQRIGRVRGAGRV